MILKPRLLGLRLARRLIPTLSFLVMNVCFSTRSVKMTFNIFKSLFNVICFVSIP